MLLCALFVSFGSVQIHYGRPAGYDMVRGCEIGNKQVELTHIEEAFTSEHWMVRISHIAAAAATAAANEFRTQQQRKQRSELTSALLVLLFACLLQVRIYRVKNEKTHPNFLEKLAKKQK
jgi:hypothetical protein